MAGGAPTGNKNAAKGKEWTEAIRHALMTYEDEKVERKQALNEIAKGIVKDALEGKHEARVEIGNRLEGKPAQAVDLTGSLSFEKIERVVINGAK